MQVEGDWPSEDGFGNCLLHGDARTQVALRLGVWTTESFHCGAVGHVAVPLTLDVLGVVYDKVSVPYHGQVHGQVADVIPFIEILQGETRESRTR